MAIDRDKLLQSAARFAEKKKYDKAIAEYQRVVEDDPSDARTLLKIGDLQARMLNYPGAIQTYERVAKSYAQSGFLVKAIAVYKQVRELIKKHAPELAAQYQHVTPRLADIYAELNLTSDALTAYDEVATLLQREGRDHEAIHYFQRTVELDPQNPLPHLRLAEAACKIQQFDAAIDSFWSAAQLLLAVQRFDDALKVVERVLHFRQEPRYAQVAAELYLKHNTKESGMLALARLQFAFKADSKDLTTLNLLAQTFEVIGEGEKAVAVHVEMARIARDKGQTALWREIVAHLEQVAPTAAEVRAVIAAGPPAQAASVRQAAPRQGAAPPESRFPVLAGGPPEDRASAPSVEVTEDAIDLDDEVEYLDDEPESEASDGGYSDEGVAVDGGSLPIEEAVAAPGSFQPSAHAHKAIVDAESFRRLGLLDKAVEALHIALEIDPNSIPIREKLREILVDAGERDAAIQETLNIAVIHLHNQDPDYAEPLALEVLEIEPDHPDALAVLHHLQALREAQGQMPLDGHLDSFDVEGVRASAAMHDVPGDAPLPSFSLDEGGPAELAPVSERRGRGSFPPSTRTSARPGPRSERPGRRPSQESIEEVLEEAEFFAAQGLYEDAEAILADILHQAPGHPLLLERLAEVQAARGAAGGALSSLPPDEAPTDKAFDIAASLDALDGFAEPGAGPTVQHVAEQVDVDQVFAKFKEGVRATVAESDAATHYDLGLAYKEMGLLPDAVAEFELASRDPSRACMCFAMVGMIRRQQDDSEGARKSFEQALAAPEKTDEQVKSLRYDLTLLAEERGDRAHAVEHLRAIVELDPSYRDASARLKALGGAPPPPSREDDDFDAAFDSLFGR